MTDETPTIRKAVDEGELSKGDSDLDDPLGGLQHRDVILGFSLANLTTKDEYDVEVYQLRGYAGQVLLSRIPLHISQGLPTLRQLVCTQSLQLIALTRAVVECLVQRASTISVERRVRLRDDWLLGPMNLFMPKWLCLFGRSSRVPAPPPLLELAQVVLPVVFGLKDVSRVKCHGNLLLLEGIDVVDVEIVFVGTMFVDQFVNATIDEQRDIGHLAQ
ncbi:uncharacterized protein SPSK_06595 [Sporothrix schenckii 1099-18]|uniref:Uncharacterized protein n=1 Tax=Sporothrix schenckii 1099-18 TaxID=1397361 RepID=A0A0F2MM02_SPOSC|nr:uncharacterized protein SPSK_06595 [Sporothrix schenckii 1099-18]KJR90064.1 hypothetical protein SPSK_06595 [Sporothrix schenckii 1099-18]